MLGSEGSLGFPESFNVRCFDSIKCTSSIFFCKSFFKLVFTKVNNMAKALSYKAF